MYYTGFADEAAADIDGQIRATRELGWECIESRNVDGKNIHDIPDPKFDEVARRLEESGVRINCFGSAIANWGKKIAEPFDSSLDEACRAIPRMKHLGTDLVRIMSFAVLQDRDPEDQMEEERFERLRTLVEMFLDEGIQPVHENCANYGGMGWPFTLRLLENVPGLRLVFDTGNPVFTADRSKPKPWPRQSAWEFYSKVRDHVAYVHIKDGVFTRERPGEIFDEARFTYPGDGDGDVKRIVSDLVARGYDGGFSIEPHLEVVFHEDQGESRDEARYKSYVEYGRRFMRIVEEARENLRKEQTPRLGDSTRS
ncbi:sugar phosphate isomerase/epimerase [Candidatus Sumerlaeota bacterium]|nr:sugar phosphate isomerase/epimerase [Candidatus Sumerlaeota bacterium]